MSIGDYYKGCYGNETTKNYQFVLPKLNCCKYVKCSDTNILCYEVNDRICISNPDDLLETVDHKNYYWTDGKIWKNGSGAPTFDLFNVLTSYKRKSRILRGTQAIYMTNYYSNI